MKIAAEFLTLRETYNVTSVLLCMPYQSDLHYKVSIFPTLIVNGHFLSCVAKSELKIGSVLIKSNIAT